MSSFKSSGNIQRRKVDHTAVKFHCYGDAPLYVKPCDFEKHTHITSGSDASNMN